MCWALLNISSHTFTFQVSAEWELVISPACDTFSFHCQDLSLECQNLLVGCVWLQLSHYQWQMWQFRSCCTGLDYFWSSFVCVHSSRILCCKFPAVFWYKLVFLPQQKVMDKNRAGHLNTQCLETHPNCCYLSVGFMESKVVCWAVNIKM